MHVQGANGHGVSGMFVDLVARDSSHFTVWIEGLQYRRVHSVPESVQLVARDGSKSRTRREVQIQDGTM
jgi:hypothetical protein